MRRKSRFFALVVALLSTSGTLLAQTVEEHMRLGDAAVQALRPAEALTHFDAIIKIDSGNFDALWKASTNAADLAEFEKDKKLRDGWYRKSEQYARKAVSLRPGDADARFHLARALGLAALSVGVKERVRYAREVRENALESLRLNPNHGGSLHVLGSWNAEVMRLSGVERLIARTFLGGGVFSQASWEEAEKNMVRAVAVDPERLTHHLDLARVYRDRKMNEKAREHYNVVINGRAVYYNDSRYKDQAAAEVARLRGP